MNKINVAWEWRSLSPVFTRQRERDFSEWILCDDAWSRSLKLHSHCRLKTELRPRSRQFMVLGWVLGAISLLLCAASLTAAPTGVESELGHWVFTSGRGDTMPDSSSGGGNAGTIKGPRWARNGGRSVLDFDGKSGVVDCGDSKVLNPSKSITVEAWIFPRGTGQGDYGRIVDRNTYSLMMHLGYGWGLAFSVQDEAGKAHSSAWGSVLPPRHWYHIVGTFDGHVQKLFVNGVEGDVTATWSGRLRASTNRLLIGNVGGGNAYAGTGGRTFDGFIDEVAVLNRALTEAEIKARYRQGRQLRPDETKSASIDPHTVFHDAFAAPKVVLQRWQFTKKSGTCLLSVVKPSRVVDSYAAYVDFRERGSWTFLSRDVLTLEAGAQYTLSAQVRRRLGYTTTKLLVRASDSATADPIAEVPITRRQNEPHELSIIFVAKATGPVRVGFEGSGYAEVWIEEVTLRRNVPPLSPYRTGLLLTPNSPMAQARFRTGAFFEAEDALATPDTVSSEDQDGDGKWAVCRLDPEHNPWLFSDNTVIKSDSAAEEEDGTCPPLKLTATNLLPGLYQVHLSDTQRDAAISLDGRTWRRVKGGAGENGLGLIRIEKEFSVWVAHRFQTLGNPGPVYVDYLRFMPVYDTEAAPEKPAEFAKSEQPPPVSTISMRLWSTSGSSRRREWVTAGIPFARGKFRPQDGIQVAGVNNLTTRPLVLWSDGSVKWLRLQFQADFEESGKELTVRFGRDVPPAGLTPLPSPASTRHTFRCGEAEITIKDGVWDQITLGGKPLVSRPPAMRFRTAGGWHLEQLRVESIRMTGDNARPGVSINGHLLTADGTPAPIAFQAVLTETAPQTLGLRFSVLNESDVRYEPEKGCSPALPLTELALVLDGIHIAPTVVQWPAAAVPFDGTTQTLLQTGAGSCVAEFQGTWSVRANDAIIASGEQTEGWLDLRDANAGLTVGVHEFVERCPRSITVRKSDAGMAIDIGLWPGGRKQPFRFAQGSRLTVEVALAPHDGTLTAPDRQARLASVLDPLCATLSPAYYCQTGVFGPVTEKLDSRFEGYSASATQTLKTLRARHMKYGMEDWGDYFDPCGYVRTDTKLWVNMEWNYMAALVVEFVRTGDPEFWRAAQQAARHFADADIIHFSSTSAWLGGSYVHTGDTREGHQVDPPNFAHAGWPEGMLWVYYMAGDERLRDASIGLADYVVRNMPPDGPYQSQPPFSMWNLARQSGNPILTLASVYELTRDPVHLQTLNRLVDFALRVQDPKLGCWSVPSYEQPAYHRPTQYWAAMLLRGLHLYWQMTGDERVVSAFQRLGNFYLEQHPPETRRDLKPGSYYRTHFTYVTEACAFASLFAEKPTPLLEKGLTPLSKKFPAATPQTLSARGAPGALIGACRLAGAWSEAESETHRQH
ncbi:MAG: hypothetical protein KAI66_08175 [Lentisphaeria bacterium]|nr:hypothetical protein [Lentisphaeria bacterium]